MRERALAGKSAQFARSRDLLLADVHFVVLLDFIEPVEVVHHHPGRLMQAAARRVREPVQALDARAVAEVKARNGVRGLAILLCVQQVVRGVRLKCFANVLGLLAAMQPIGLVEVREQLDFRRMFGRFPRLLECVLQPRAETGNRRERGEGLDARELVSEPLGHLFDQQIAERDAAQSGLAVCDRIENRGVRRMRI